MTNKSTALLIDDPLYFAADLAQTCGEWAARWVDQRRWWMESAAHYRKLGDAEMLALCEQTIRLAFTNAVENAKSAAHWANVAIDLLADEPADRAEAFFAALQEVAN